MSEIIGVITNVEDDKDFNQKDYKKVILGTGQVLNVKQGREGMLRSKWGLLQVGVAIKFTMMDFTKPDGVKIPFVSDIETVGGGLAPPVKPEMLPEHKEEIAEAVASVAGSPPAKEQPPNPQAVGMITKEIGDMIRAKYLVPIFGDEASQELIKWYRSQTLGITRIPFDGNKLPKFGIKLEEKKEE